MTLSPFTSAEGKRERSPRRRSPRSSSRAAPRSVRCSPAPSSPAPPLWCVAQAGPGRRGRTSRPGASTLLNGAHQPVGTAQPSPSVVSSFFPTKPGAPHSAPPLHQCGGEQPRPSCQALLALGQTLLAPSDGAPPPPSSRASWGWGGREGWGAPKDVGGL